MEESAKNLELVDQAIKLLAEKRNKETSCDDDLLPDDSDQLLSRLLSELESLKGDDAQTCAIRVIIGDGGSEEIVKELRTLRRQNFVTHCLLSVMIARHCCLAEPMVKIQKNSSQKINVPPLKIPEPPHIDFGSNGEKHS
ncbi:F17L21.9 [Salix viminalis]|uniref:F17L21.9 n=1 Tax=Salix viminalis TaxID=40686 RepID=A0A9Q0YXI5_SALVM|nr:F17L21.9 [Salix viminalis]